LSYNLGANQDQRDLSIYLNYKVETDYPISAGYNEPRHDTNEVIVTHVP